MFNLPGKGPIMLGVWLILLVVLASCGSSTPTGPTTTVEGNTAPVTVNNVTGTNGAVGSAPCAATTNSNTGTHCPTTTSTTNGSTDVTP